MKKNLIVFLMLAFLSFAGYANAEQVCTTTEEEVVGQECHIEAIPHTENVCQDEIYTTEDKVCKFSFFGICLSWGTVITEHTRTVCQDVTIYTNEQVCEDVITTEPVETCEDVPDEPVVEPEKPAEPIVSNGAAIIYKIPSVTDYFYTKLAAGIYEFRFSGKNLSGSRSQIKWGKDIVDVSFAGWEKYEDTKLVYIPEGQKQVVFWVRNGQSTGKVLTVNL